jgi:hypothetical protein
MIFIFLDIVLCYSLKCNVTIKFPTLPQILEAITTLRCCEDFSMERLELLGDSVLKYAVSAHLFMTFLNKHEGQLSSRRQETICNATLYRFGIERRIQVIYISSSAIWTKCCILLQKMSYNTTLINFVIDGMSSIGLHT